MNGRIPGLIFCYDHFFKIMYFVFEGQEAQQNKNSIQFTARLI